MNMYPATRSLHSSLLIAITLLAASASAAQAASQTWAATGNGDWNTGGSWGGTPVPGVSGTSDINSDIATLGTVGSGTHTVTDSVTNRALGQINFTGTGSAGSYVIGSGSNTLYFHDYNGTANISTAATTGNETIASNLSITGANNNATGNDLRIQTASGYTGTLTLSGNISASTGSANISGLRIVTSAASSTTPGDNIGNVVVLSGNITDGTGKVAISRARNGILVLSGVNTYSGGFVLGADGNDGLSANSITEIGVDSVGSAGSVTSGAFGTGVLNILGGVISSNGAANRTIYNNFTENGATLYTGLTSGSTGSLTFAGTGTLNNTFTVNTLTATTFSGSLITGTATGSLYKSGVSTLTLTGANTYAGFTTVSNGTLVVGTGGAIDNANATNGSLSVGDGSNKAVLSIRGGKVNVNNGGGASANFFVGQGTGASTVALSSGTLNVIGWSFIGTGTGATGVSTGGYGSFDLSGGVANFGGYFALNRVNGSGTNSNSAGTGILNMTGGALNVTSGAFDVGAFADPTAAGSRGVANISSGTVTVSGNTDGGHADIYVGEYSYGILNLSGTGVIQDSVATYGMTVGAHTGATGIVNLNGGTLAVPYINTGTNTATSILNFNGGVLKATTGTSSFLTGLTAAYVYSGGGTIDNGSNAITIGQALLAPAGSGVTSVIVSSSGSGYQDTPLVTFTGGTLASGGAPATGYAVLTNGVVTSIVITNPGNYTSTSGLTVSLTGGGGTGATLGTIATAADVSGGLTFAGAGTTTLTGANTYTGVTHASAGTLNLGTATTLQNSTVSIDANNTVAFTNGIGAFTVGGIAGSGNEALADTASAAIALTLGNNNQAASYSGILSGGGSVTKLGTGTQTFAGANSYTGGTILSAGTLQLSGAGTIGSTTGTLTMNGGVLDVNGTAQTVGNLVGSAGTILNNGGANVTFTVGNGFTGTSNFQGQIADNSGGGNTHTLAITKTGTGTFTFSGANTYTGGTTISSGALKAGTSSVGSTSGAFGGSNGVNTGVITLGDANTGANIPALLIDTPSVTVANAITVANQGSNIDLIGSSVSMIGTSTFTGNITLNKAVTLEATGSGVVDFTTGTWTTNGNAVTIGTTGHAGTVQIDNAIADAGGITVNAGTLKLNSAFTLGNMTVNAGTTLAGHGSVGGTTSVTNATINGTGLVLGGHASYYGLGTNTLAGSVTANNGVEVTAGVALNLSGALTGAMVLDSGSTLNGTGTGGSVSGTTSVTSATINGNGSGNTTLGGVVTFDGAANFLNGTVAATNGIAIVNSAGLTQEGVLTGSVSASSSGTSDFDGTVAGAGTFTVSNGLVQMTGFDNNSYTGLTTVSGGELDLNKGSAPFGGVTAIAGNGGSIAHPDILVTGGTLKWLLGEQVGNNAAISITGGTASLNGQVETVGVFSNSGGTFTTGVGGQLIGTGSSVTWSGGINTVNDGGLVEDQHVVINGGTNTVEGGTSGGVLQVDDGGTGLEMTGGTLTLNSDANVAGKLQLGKPADAGTSANVTTHASATTASIDSAGAGAHPGVVDLNGGTSTFTVAKGTTSSGVDLNVSAVIQNGAVAKSGAGSMVVTAANTYGGGTTINAGNLYANNATSSLGTGTVTVQGTGTLGGTGTVAGKVNVQSGGTLASGAAQNPASHGVDGTHLTLTSDLFVTGGGNLTFALGAVGDTGTGPDNFPSPNLNSTYLNTSGAVTFDTDHLNGAVNINLVDLTVGSTTDTLQLRFQNPYLLIADSSNSNLSYNLVTDHGYDVNGYVLGIGTLATGDTILNTIHITMYDTDGNVISSSTNYQNLKLYLYNGKLEVVPEPGTWALMLGGLAVLLVVQRRRAQR